MNTTKLLLHCKDRAGIVTDITNFISINNGNIIYLDQHVNYVENIFFMRMVPSAPDAGPIIEQDIVRVTHKDIAQDLINKGKDLEKIVLSHAVQKHIERKVLAYKNKTVIFR